MFSAVESRIGRVVTIACSRCLPRPIFRSMTLRTHLVTDGFFAGAGSLRRELEAAFDPRRDPFDRARFRWEPWFEGGFSQLRAPAASIFAAATLVAFEARLLAFASRFAGAGATLGGPLWVSILVDGHHQSLHRDSPNGTFALSYGVLPRGPRRFRGGETEIARPELLDYWGSGAHAASEAAYPLFDVVEPKRDRLVLFDARIPHAVRRVEGSSDPRAGRAAIQGWVVARAALGDAQAPFARALARAPAAPRGASGVVTLKVEASGAKVRRVAVTAALLGEATVAYADRLAKHVTGARGIPAGTFVVPMRVEQGKRPRLA